MLYLNSNEIPNHFTFARKLNWYFIGVCVIKYFPLLIPCWYTFTFCLGHLSDSHILGSLNSKYLDQLNSYLVPVLKSSSRSRFFRCWRGKTDGWVPPTFQSNCGGKGPTVTIIKVGSYIFGGYTDVSWSRPSKYHFMVTPFS